MSRGENQTEWVSTLQLPGWSMAAGGAIVMHGLALSLLILAPYRDAGTPEPEQLSFRLVVPAEGHDPVFMASSNPQAPLPPEGQDAKPDAEMLSGGELLSPFEETAAEITDAELAELLAAERESLRAELEELTELAHAAPLPGKPQPLPPPEGGNKGRAGPGPEGAIRELDLSGFPQPVVDDVMKRYKLKVVTRRFEAGQRGQNFLSSASKGSSERFFGGLQTVQPGLYEVFLLSRESVAHMSRLEEDALRQEGLEPLKARVIRIVFGIVQTQTGEYELGVKTLEAEPVE